MILHPHSYCPKEIKLPLPTRHTLSPVYKDLTEKLHFEPVFWNGFLLADTRNHCSVLQLLKTKGCLIETVLYFHSTGNNRGNYYFHWLVPSAIGVDKLLSQNTAMVQNYLDCNGRSCATPAITFTSQSERRLHSASNCALKIFTRSMGLLS